MKSIRYIFILFLMVSMISCSKKNDTDPNPIIPKDYRTQYLGDYYCTGEKSTSYRGDSNNYTTHMTTVIHFYKAEGDSNILIFGKDLMQDSSIVTLFKDNSFRREISYDEISSGGIFILDSLYFNQGQVSFGMSSLLKLKGKRQ